MAPANCNTAVSDLPYYTSQHLYSPATPKELSSKTPTLFTPLEIRNAALRNRIIVSPMCQYFTAPNGPHLGALTDWHVATPGHYAIKGAAISLGLCANRRFERVADFVKSQGALVEVQLAHAGRKSSTTAPWVSTVLGRKSKRADKDVNGWPDNVKGPSGRSDQAWNGSFDRLRKSSKKECEGWTQLSEIHAAHEYLLHQFLSLISNRRANNEYGGTFENRTRLLFEVIKAIRAIIPETMPLFLRIPSTEFLEDTDLGKGLGSWDVDSTIKVAKQLPALGVDLLDASSGGNHPGQRVDEFNIKGYQVNITSQIRSTVRAENLKPLIGAVAMITESEQAKNIVEKTRTDSVTLLENRNQEEAGAGREPTNAKNGKQPQADVIPVARQFLREPNWVFKVAYQLGVDICWPSQFLRAASVLKVRNIA